MTSINSTGHGPGCETHQASDQLGFDFTDRELTAAERFERFHADNPHVLNRLIQMARQWRAATGGRKLGIRTLWEAMRWDIGLHTSGEDYKLNDHYTSFYVRLIVTTQPDLADMFELRRSPEADAWIGRAA